MSDGLQRRIAEAEDASEALLARLIVGQQQMLDDLAEFRAETAAGFESLRSGIGGSSGLSSIAIEQARQGERLDQMQSMLEQILRRPSS